MPAPILEGIQVPPGTGLPRRLLSVLDLQQLQVGNEDGAATGGVEDEGNRLNIAQIDVGELGQRHTDGTEQRFVVP